METKWLEDFVSLAETRSFSRSAQLRHVTQPAFSPPHPGAGSLGRHRSGGPQFLPHAPDGGGQDTVRPVAGGLQALQNTRAMLRAHSTSSQDMIEFAVPHTLAFTFFPAWVASLHSQFGPFKSRLIALNVHDAVMRLVEGSCDVLVTYHHESQPFQLDANHYEMVSLGKEVLSPYSKPRRRRPTAALPARQAGPAARIWGMRRGPIWGG